MTEQVLDHSDIHTRLQQVGGKGMSQRVWRYPNVEPTPLSRTFEDDTYSVSADVGVGRLAGK
jgi:hypothetical protein